LAQYYEATLTPGDFVPLQKWEKLLQLLKKKFEPLLVDHLGGGHSQSVLLAMGTHMGITVDGGREVMVIYFPRSCH
jgi:hypothetical protein